MSLKNMVLITCLVMGAPAQGARLAQLWFDVSLDAQGKVTEVIEQSEIEPVLVEPVSEWLSQQAFTIATWNEQPAHSTTSVWVDLVYEIVDSDVAMTVRSYGSGPRLVRGENASYEVFRGPYGHVTVRFTVKANGRVSNIEVIESTVPTKNRRTVKAVRTWRFKPETVLGEPIESVVEHRTLYQDPYPAMRARHGIEEPDQNTP